MDFQRKLVLGSSSPRRLELLAQAGYRPVVCPSHATEDYPGELPVEQTPAYLASKKVNALRAHPEAAGAVALCADTVVILEGAILHKPADREEARAMLARLSGKTHTVITGVCVVDGAKTRCFDDATKVTFRPLESAEITYYVDAYNPLDKAGGYGIQDWIGLVGIVHICGSYSNVMGLPMHKVHSCLQTL